MQCTFPLIIALIQTQLIKIYRALIIPIPLQQRQIIREQTMVISHWRLWAHFPMSIELNANSLTGQFNSFENWISKIFQTCVFSIFILFFDVYGELVAFLLHGVD